MPAESAAAGRPRNWSGTFSYRAGRIEMPRSEQELAELVLRSTGLSAVGSRHSFNAIADSETLVSTELLPGAVSIAADRRSVTVPAAMTYGLLAPELAGAGLALANLASLPHIAVGGAIATGTHGSGLRNRGLAGAVLALRMMRSDGEIVELDASSPDFAGAVVHLGALGVLLEVTLQTQAAFEVEQRVFLGMPLQTVIEHLDEIHGCGYSVSAFTRFDGANDQIWVKTLAGREPADALTWRLTELGATAAAAAMHPLGAGLSPENCTEQLGAPGPWYDRLPHFRIGFTPSNGREIQTEFLLDRADAAGALRAIAGLGAQLSGLLQVCEIRAVAADEFWMSPAYGRDSVAVHFTWNPDSAAVMRACAALQTALAPYGPRPHWGKVFDPAQVRLRELYPRLDDFVQLAQRLDPRGAFRSPWLAASVFAA